MSSGKMLQLQFLIKLVDGLFLLFDVFSCTGEKIHIWCQRLLCLTSHIQSKFLLPANVDESLPNKKKTSPAHGWTGMASVPALLCDSSIHELSLFI